MEKKNKQSKREKTRYTNVKLNLVLVVHDERSVTDYHIERASSHKLYARIFPAIASEDTI